MINNKLIIAHRGASSYEKENTIAAFKKAIELNSDMIEFDIRKTRDNKIIVFHDEDVEKKKIEDMNYEEVINKSECKVPTLEETLKSLSGKTKIIVHLKEEGYEEEVMNLILKYFKKDEIIVFSEFPNSLRKIKERYSHVKTGFVILVKYRNYVQVPFGFFQKKKILYSRADYIAPPWQIVNKIFLIKAKRLKKPVLPWEVRNRKLAKKLLKRDIIAGIITNKPDLMD